MLPPVQMHDVKSVSFIFSQNVIPVLFIIERFWTQAALLVALIFLLLKWNKNWKPLIEHYSFYERKVTWNLLESKNPDSKIFHFYLSYYDLTHLYML